MEQLLNIINTIATTKFVDKYNFLSNHQNKQNNTILYKNCLKEWNLYSELDLVNNETKIKEKIGDDRRLNRVFNQSIFKKGEYNSERYSKLRQLF